MNKIKKFIKDIGFMGITALVEAFIFLIIGFLYGIRIDNLKNEINLKDEKILKQSKEIIELKLIEEDYNSSKDYIYECFKQIENNAKRSGK